MKVKIRKIIALIVSLCVLLSFTPMSLAEGYKKYIVSVSDTNGSAFTDNSTLASKLDSIFAGNVEFYTQKSSNGPDSRYLAIAPLGDTNTVNTTKYIYIKNIGKWASGSTCFIYASAVYNTLFGDSPLSPVDGGDMHSVKIIDNSTKLSGSELYQQFMNAGVKTGAFMQTSTNGTSHSMILLSYNEKTISYLAGNDDGNGLIRIGIKDWDSFNNFTRDRYLRRVYQPTNEWYNQMITPTCTHSQGYETVCEGGRYFARCKQCHEEFNPEFKSDSAGTYRITSNIKLNSAPYQEAQTSVSCKIGQQVTIRGHVINAYNNKWYQTTDGYYIYHEYAELVQQTSTLSVSGHTGNPGTPTGTLTRGSNFGLRGIITSNYTITNVEAHIYDSNGKDAKGTTEYKTNWNSKSYNIQTDGINNHFSFSALTNGTYRYVVKASDSATNEMKTLIESWFNVGTSTTPVQQYLDQCTSKPCNVTLTVTVPGHMNIMPCSTQTNSQAATVSDDDKNLTVGNTYHSTVRWTNTVGHIWYETTSKTGQRGFVYSGDVSVTTVINIGDYSDPNINSTLSISGYEGGIPAGNLVQGSNFGLRGVISSNYTITHIEAHIYKSDGTDALPSYSTDWNSTNYDIRTDGINNHFHFRDLPTGTNYNYSVRASDSSGTSLPLIDSFFNVGTSSTSTLTYLNLDGLLDGAPNDGLAQYGTADVYINGQLVANACNDYWEAWTPGTTYEIKNVRANDGYRFNGVYSGSLSGTIGTERINVVLSFSKTAILDLNGWLDNNLSWGNIDGYGVVDIYINDELVADSVSDYCSDYPIGTKYEIKNIRALDGHHYDGVHSGILSGTIGSECVEVYLAFSKLTHLNLDGFLDGTESDTLGNYGKADIYINGNLVAEEWNDYWEAWPIGTTYEIKNIVANPGYHYNGVYSGSLSGTIGTERVNVVLSFGINTSGVCGDSITWRLEDDKLFIEGTGEMYDYFYYPPWYSSRLSIKEVRISDGVTTIGNDTCHYCTNLESVSIPDSITSIGVSAFSECSSLASIKIPENVTRIDDYAFYYCERLTDIQIPNNVAYIGEWAFVGCANLKSVTIPDSVSYIGTYAFFGCNSLPSIVIPYFVTSIGEYTFSSCSSMESITIPNSVKSIDHHAFDSCSHLSNVYYMGTEAQWRLIAISADNESLTNATIHYLTEPDFILPFSLKKIEDEAFEGGVFTFAKLSDNVAMIGSRAFADCPNLKYIYIPAATKTIAADAFAGVDGLTILGASGSTAETYAAAHGYTFVAVS